ALLLGEGVLGVPGPAGAHRDRLGRRGAAAQVDVAGDGQGGDVPAVRQVEVAAAVEDALVLHRVAGVVGVGVGLEVPVHRAAGGLGPRRGAGVVGAHRLGRVAVELVDAALHALAVSL